MGGKKSPLPPPPVKIGRRNTLSSLNPRAKPGGRSPPPPSSLGLLISVFVCVIAIFFFFVLLQLFELFFLFL